MFASGISGKGDKDDEFKGGAKKNKGDRGEGDDEDEKDEEGEEGE